MTLLILECASGSLRGDLSRWMIEIQAGVFVGRLPARVREKIWRKACFGNLGGGCTMVHSAANEQGFLVRSIGHKHFQVLDYDGLALVCRS